MARGVRWVTSSVDDGVTYPAAPWPLAGSLWLTLFRLGHAHDRHPAGLYGTAFVSYDHPSPLTYGELLVARPVRTPHGRRISITDIWVDSPASVAGGRELWAIPKQLAEIDRETARDGPVGTTAWTARVDGRPVAAARFHDVTRRAPRLPYRAGLWHEGLLDTGGEERVATMRGAAGITPTRARWTFAPTGALGWLARARQLGSLRLADFRMDFG